MVLRKGIVLKMEIMVSQKRGISVAIQSKDLVVEQTQIRICVTLRIWDNDFFICEVEMLLFPTSQAYCRN